MSSVCVLFAAGGLLLGADPSITPPQPIRPLPKPGAAPATKPDPDPTAVNPFAPAPGQRGSSNGQKGQAKSKDEPKPKNTPKADPKPKNTSKADPKTTDDPKPQASPEDPGKLDVIVLLNGHSLRGTIDLDTETGPDYVAIKTTTGGRLVLAKSAIRHLDLGFDTRRKALKPDDWEGRLALVQWCLQQPGTDYRSKALEVLRECRSRCEADLEGLRLLAMLIDEQAGGAEEALALYQRYRDQGGKDQATLDRLKTLEEQQSSWKDLLAKSLQDIKELPPAPPEPEVVDGLEAQTDWKAESPQYANRVDVQVVRQEVSKDRWLQLIYQGGDRYKAAVILGCQLDLRTKHLLRMRISNPNQDPVRISIAVKTGANYRYFETNYQAVPSDQQKFHQLEFDLTAKAFKCDADNFRTFSHAVADPGDVRELQIQIHNQRRDGKVLINDLILTDGG